MTKLLEQIFKEAAGLPGDKQDELAQRLRKILPDFSRPIVNDSSENKWAMVAKELSKKAPLTGFSDGLRKHAKEFRDNFALKNPLQKEG